MPFFIHTAENPDRQVGDECVMREGGRGNGSFPVEERRAKPVENREVLKVKLYKATGVSPWSFTVDSGRNLTTIALTMDEQQTQNISPDEKNGSDDFEKIQKERDEYLDGWKRAKADFINYKKEELGRIEQILKLSNEQLIRDLLPVLDSFDLALESFMVSSSNHSDTKIEKGVYLIRSQLEDVLKKYGLEKIAVQPGMMFDPAIHDAVVSVESSQESGTVVEEVERGYRLGEKLIRAARVKVAK